MEGLCGISIGSDVDKATSPWLKYALLEGYRIQDWSSASFSDKKCVAQLYCSDGDYGIACSQRPSGFDNSIGQWQCNKGSKSWSKLQVFGVTPLALYLQISNQILSKGSSGICQQ